MLESKHLCLTENLVGEILIEDVFDDEGNIIMSKNSVINEYAFQTLLKTKVDKVKIYPSIKENFTVSRNKPELCYKESIIEMQKIMARLATGEGISLNRLDMVSSSLSLEINKNNQIIGNIGRIKDKDEYTYNHSINVAIYSAFIGKLIGLDEEENIELIQASLLHDIGKSKVPKEILNKKGRLTEEEFIIVKKHTTDGYIMSKRISCLTEDVREAILYHHEREDGSGYPHGVKGHKINIYAKIISIADVYDALTSERVYKDKSSPFDAIKEFYRMGIQKFSRPILAIFFKNVVQFYVNCRVKLNDGTIGKIEFVHPQNITGPIVNVEGNYINLSQDNSLKIEEIVE